MNKYKSIQPELLKFYSSSIWRKTREYIKIRDNGICKRCGCIGKEVHHIVPLTMSNYQSALAIDPNNLELLCERCHLAERGSDVKSDQIIFGPNGEVIKKA